MIESLIATLPLQLHEYAIRPYEEGLERVSRAIQGVDFTSIFLRPLTWGERAVSLLVGVCLLLPFVNTIIWIGAKFFGNLDVLSAANEVEETDSESETDEAAPVFEPLSSPLSTETIRYIDTKEGKSVEANWTIRRYSSKTVAEKTDPIDTVHSEYDPEGALCYFHNLRNDPPGELTVTRTEHHIKVEGKRGGKTFKLTHKVDPNIAWVQQATIGFRSFVLSDHQKLEYYGIDPTNGHLLLMVANKEKLMPLPPYGEVLKVNATFSSFIGNFWGAQLWFDPVTGELCQMEHKEPGSHWYQFVLAVCKKALP